MPSITSTNFRSEEAQAEQTPRKCGLKLFVGISVIMVAFFYINEPCEYPVIQLLLSLGTVLVSHYFISQLSPKDFSLPMLACLEVILLIWGTVTVLSEYSRWQYTDPKQLGFCPRALYLTAFIYLIAYYIIIGIAIIVGCCLTFLKVYEKCY